MAQLLVNAKRSAILVAVLSIIGSCADNATDAITAEVNQTAVPSTPKTMMKLRAFNRASLLDEDDHHHDEDYGQTFSQNTTTRRTTNNSTTDDGARTDGGSTISIAPLPDGIDLPPAAMMLIAGITCGVIIGVFLICYIATMMNLCFCKFLMHECPSGRFKDEERKEKPSKKKKGKGDEEAKNAPSSDEPSPGPASP
uniref:Tyramine/octopamine receptor n=2 Tax=Lygus hesperus TaxID=30085 RepID=A0A0A9YVH1_LYGHE